MPGPQNAIMGDDSFGTDIPETATPVDSMAEVQKSAKFSKTAEFKELKDYLQSRMDYYRVYMPNGEPIIKGTTTNAELGNMWVAANVIIGEFKAIIDVYEQAAQMVKDTKKNAAS